MRILLIWIFMAILNVPDSEKKMTANPFLNQNEKPLFSFGLIADAQYCDCEPAGTRFYRSSLAKMRDALNVFKEHSVSFAVNLGDLIDRDFHSYDSILGIIKSSGLKTYHCTGNHDYSVTPEFKARIPVLQPGNERYYSLTIKNFRLIFLDGNEISTYSTDKKEAIEAANNYIRKLKNEGAINAIEWNAGIGSVQISWLDTQLKEATARNQKTIIFCHFPVAPVNIHNLLNYNDILSVIENNKSVVAWFNGHNHAGNYTVSGGVHFKTMKGMVESEAVNSFAIAEVYENRIVIRGYGDEKDQILLFK